MPVTLQAGPLDGAEFDVQDLNSRALKWVSLQDRPNKSRVFVFLPPLADLETGRPSKRSPAVYERVIGPERVEYRHRSSADLAVARQIDAALRGEIDRPGLMRQLIDGLLRWAHG
jgi:hypothetical protein